MTFEVGKSYRCKQSPDVSIKVRKVRDSGGVDYRFLGPPHVEGTEIYDWKGWKFEDYEEITEMKFEVGKKYNLPNDARNIIEILFLTEKKVLYKDRYGTETLNSHYMMGDTWQEYHEPKKYWINVFERSNGERWLSSTLFALKDDAERCGKAAVGNCIKTIEIEV